MTQKIISYSSALGLRLLDPMPEELHAQTQVTPEEANKHFAKIWDIALCHRMENSLFSPLVFATVTMDNTKYGALAKFQKWELLNIAIDSYKASLTDGYWYSGYIEYTAQHVPHFHFITNQKSFCYFKDAFGHLGRNNKKCSGWNFGDVKDLQLVNQYISKDHGDFRTNIYRNYFIS